MNVDPDVLDRVKMAIRRRYGSATRIENVSIPTSGQSNRTWLFEIVPSVGDSQRAVLRQQTYSGPGNPFIPSEFQYRAIQIAREVGVPTPEPYFLLDPDDELGKGFAMAYVEGETLPKRILEESIYASVRPRLASQCAEIFALLHSIDSAKLDFLQEIPDSIDPITTQQSRMDTYREAHPALEIGFRWLNENRPVVRQRTLIHGDFRNGNFIIGARGIRAVLDWECCHVGSPMEDLGWLCTRSWRFGRFDYPVGGFGRRQDLYDTYELASGNAVDPVEVHYWEIFGLVRWAVINLMQAFGHVKLGRSSVVFAACGRNCAEIEYDLLRTLDGTLD